MKKKHTDHNLLLYSIGHDLKAPIKNTVLVISHLETALEQGNKEVVSESVQLLKNLATEAQLLVQGLMLYTEYEQVSVKIGHFETGRVCKHLAKTLADPYNNRQIKFVIGDLPDLEGDPLLLRKVVMNLINNAIKFTQYQDVAHIEIYSKTTQEGHEIYVKDNGVGFPESKAQLIFEPFKTAHNRAEYPGSGIGLSICKLIIEQHGGKIWAENNPEGGARFGFFIPM